MHGREGEKNKREGGDVREIRKDKKEGGRSARGKEGERVGSSSHQCEAHFLYYHEVR